MAALDGTSKISNLLERWERETPVGKRLVYFLTKLADMLEHAIEVYFKQDRDPFDCRHPSRQYPDCTIGHMLKRITRHAGFLNALLGWIVDRSKDEIHTMSCRLLTDLLLGIDSAYFHDKDELINKLFLFAEQSQNPVQSYATGILACIMEEHEVATKYKEKNASLVPLVLERLNDLSCAYWSEQVPNPSVESFVHISHKPSSSSKNRPSRQIKRKRKISESIEHLQHNSITRSKNQLNSTSDNQLFIGEHSNSSWPDMEALMIGSYQIYPLTKADEQRYIIEFLTSVGEYPELLTPVFEKPLAVLRLILSYINFKEHTDVRLTFSALKYLSILLCHKKCASEFISKIGIESILKVHRSSLAAPGVSFVLYNLSCNDDAMQTVCLLDKKVIQEVVSYALSLIERSHQSGQSYGTIYFGNTFKYPIILDSFDGLDGLRKIINLVSTLEVIVHNLNKDLSGGIMSSDQVLSGRQLCHQVCITLKHYFEAHAEAKAVEFRRHQKLTGVSTYINKSMEENVQTLLDLLPSNAVWKPVNQFLKLDGVSFLLKVIAMHYDWLYQGKMETVRCALDVLYICSVVNKGKLALCNDVHYMSVVHEEMKKIGMSIILKTAFGDRYTPEIQRSALNIIINCVCYPASVESQVASTASVPKKRFFKNEEEVLNKMFNCVRANDGIMTLKCLITTRSPLTDADSIRALACELHIEQFTCAQRWTVMQFPIRIDFQDAATVQESPFQMALCGLSRCSKVIQIVSKLPLFTTGQLQVLMREPVLKDKQTEHAQFVKYCKILIGMVAGRAASAMETLMSNIDKVEVIAETVISYDDVQLLQLIVQHLREKGLVESARCLQTEANLKDLELRKHVATESTLRNSGVQVTVRNQSPSIYTKLQKTALPFPIDEKFDIASTSAISSSKSSPSWILHSPSSSGYSMKKVLSLSEAGNVRYANTSSSSSKSISLHAIVTEYLRNQHARCLNPFVTCPPFDLYKMHECPVPICKTSLSKNIALQITQKQVNPNLWAYNGVRSARKYLSCKLREINAYFDNEFFETLCCCEFDAHTENAFIGLYNGQIVTFPKTYYEPNEISVIQAHETFVSSIQITKYSPLVLTSASWRKPVSAVWCPSIRNWNLGRYFEDECYMEFNKLNCDRIIATKYERARIYDTTTGKAISTLCRPDFSNKYTCNKATFSYTDELVLHDGLLWDRRQPHPIHKLDKLNPTHNGVFHPNGLEIVSNTEIWDMRTFRLLRTVPDLEQCDIIFDQQAHVFYAVINYLGANTKEPSFINYGTSLRVFDARDYACVATKDFQRQIHGLAIDISDRYLAVVQNRSVDAGYREESICRIYEIGRSVEDDDESGRDDTEDEDVIDDHATHPQSDDNEYQGNEDDSFGDDVDNEDDNDDDNDNSSRSPSHSDAAMDESTSGSSSSDTDYFNIH